MGGNASRASPELPPERPSAVILDTNVPRPGRQPRGRRPGTGGKRARWRATPPATRERERRAKRRAAPDRTERLQTQVPGPARGERRGAGTTAATHIASPYAAAVRDGSGSPPRSERRE